MKTLLLLLALALTVPACNPVPGPGGGKSASSKKGKKGKKDKKAKRVKRKPAPAVEWSSISKTNLNFKENKEAGLKYDSRVSVSIYEGKLKISPVKLPKGTVIEAEGKSIVEQGKYQDLEIDVEKRLMDEPWSTFQHSFPKVDWRVPFSVTLPGYKPVKEVTPPVQVGFVVGAYYKGLEKEGATFLWPGEKGPGAGPIAPAAAWTWSDFKALGTAEKVRDVRWVAVVDTELNGKTRTCGGYIGVSAVTVNAYDATVRIVDRFTGATMTQKTFKGTTRCPRTVYAKPGEKVVQQTGPSVSAMQKWTVGQLKRLPKTL